MGEKEDGQQARSHIPAWNSDKLEDSKFTPDLPRGSQGVSAGLEGQDLFYFSLHVLVPSATNVRTGLFPPTGI